MSMFGHAARLSRDDPVHRIISCSDPPEWRKPYRSLLTWLKQMDGHCQRLGTDRLDAWALAKGDSKAYTDLVQDAAKHLSSRYRLH